MFVRCLFLGLILSSTISLYPQNAEVKFHHLRVEDGLSRSWVKCIYQDSMGFLWFGTDDGLNRYDGYQFKVYKYDLAKSEGINGNIINVIFEDSRHNLWVGTQVGLNLYNRELDEFIPLSAVPNYIDCIYEFNSGKLLIGSPGGLFLYNSVDTSAEQIFDNIYVDAILQDKSGNLWLGTYDGLWLLKTDDYSYIPYRRHENDPQSISDNVIRTLYEDNYGNIWVGTNTHGVSLMQCDGDNPDGIKFINLEHNPKNKSSISKGAILALTEDAKNNLWIGIENGGLNIINLKETKESALNFKHLVNNPTDNSSISNNSVHVLYRDRQNTMWVGTYGDGINYSNPLLQKFKHYRHIPNQKNSLNNNHVNVIYEEGRLLWLGTEGGLNLYNKEKNIYTHFVFDPNDPNSLGSDAVWSICRDSRNNLWIGTWEGGLNLFNEKNQSFTRFTFNENNDSSIGSNSVYEIMEDSEGDLWIATMGGGLNKYNYTNGTFKRYQVDLNRNSISNNWVITLLEAHDGKLWISTTTAVDVFDKKTGKFKTYTQDAADSTSISYNSAIAIYEDSKNHIWIGTNAGLNLYHPVKDNFSYYLVKDGLPDNTIKAICEDDHNNLWLTTNNGLSKFIDGVNIPAKPVFKNYDMSDGLQGNEFNSRSIFKGEGDIIYAGGNNGFNAFHPDSISNNNYLSEVVFTDFLIFNKPVKIGDKESPLSKHIGESEEVILSHRHSVFSIEFSALNYIAPEKNQYAFMLEGFEKDWNYVGTQRIATYTNLDPGKYVFLVKTSNSDGLWNEQATCLKITVLPPWWRTTAAKIVYVILIFLSLYFFRRYTLISVNLKNRLWLEHLQKEKDEELSQMKFQFYTNISHELRTPLTLITGPLERLINKGLAFSELQIIRRNVSHLRNLVDQILDFRKVENNMMHLNLKACDIVCLVENSVNGFFDYANQKNIKLNFNTQIEKLIIQVDADKMEKILDNLLINALKYTPDDGLVTVKLEIKKTSDDVIHSILIEIADTGKGIAPEDQKKIFDRFYTSEGYEDSIIGTGIGLHLTKKFIELHEGTISLKSEIDQGSVFSIEIPVQEVHYEAKVAVEKLSSEIIIPEKLLNPDLVNGTLNTENLKTILIIDDNEEMCDYLKLILSEDYYTFAATSSLSGFEQAIHYMPDIIISDVVMPKLDGFELCKKIKTDIRVSHIPVILLTAKATTEDNIIGFETGADDYIYKPFDENLLKSRIRNLIKQREIMKEHFIGSDGSINPEIPENSLDKLFIKKLYEITHKKYMDPSFNVNNIIRDMGMSRSVFYKKLRALSKLSINDLIKNVRMNKAKELLLKNSLTISEVAYDTGFSDPAYFSKVFKEQYKISPKEFKRHISKI